MNNRTMLSISGGVLAGLVLAACATPTATKHENTITTQNVVKASAPQSCIDALDAAQSVAAVELRFANSAAKYPDLVTRAAKAGFDQNASALNDVTAVVSTITSELDSEATDLKAAVASFNTSAASCRSN